MATIVLTGGGTGGHVIPALALLPELKKHFEKIYFIGGNGIEKRLSEEKGLPFFTVDTIKFDRKYPLKNLKIPSVLGKGVRECEALFEKIKPDVVFSKGGYVALPACFAARKRGVPVVCHESDLTMGLANKLTSRFAAKVLTSFPSTKGGKYVGNPVREEILTGNKTRAEINLKMQKGRKTVLFFGGSQGAAALNKVVFDALPTLTKTYNVIHISGGSGDFTVPQTPTYRQLAFSNEMPDLLALCDVVVCRAGANALFEIAAVGKPALCIPLPKGNSRGDQLLNAEYFRKKGYVDVLPQDRLDKDVLLEKINALSDFHPPKLDVSLINQNVVKEIISVVK